MSSGCTVISTVNYNCSTQQCDELVAKPGLMADVILVNELVDLVRLLIFVLANNLCKSI